MREDLAVTSYATAQRPGDGAFQCDATAVCTAPDGTRAYALLDGVGDTLAVRSWTRAAARRLARAAAEHADAEAGLRAEYGHYTADPARTAGHGLPCAAGVVAVHVPGGIHLDPDPDITGLLKTPDVPRPQTDSLTADIARLKKTDRTLRSRHAAEQREARATTAAYANHIQALTLRNAELEVENAALREALHQFGGNVASLPVTF
ncbi:hypothetical protein ACIP3A_30365 [Streptomyces tricolor]|uniref:hypothetical protein n=1 Tax=Streptomyces tricolor TaxID=68277 RepID=UPI0037F76200